MLGTRTCIIMHNFSKKIKLLTRTAEDSWAPPLTRVQFVTTKKPPLICLFIWDLTFNSRTFHLFGDVTSVGEGLQILTYTRHSWPLSSEDSLASHIYCDRSHPFIMVISEEHARRTIYTTAQPRWSSLFEILTK